MMFQRPITLLYLLITLVQAVLPPSIDPFYQPPPGFESQPAGSILRSRRIIPGNLGLIAIPVEGTQLLYRTRSINGSAIAMATTVLKPFGAQSGRFVSFQNAEDSSWINCAPSYNYQQGAIDTNPIVIFEGLFIQAYLSAGYIVSTPDHEGPDAAFAAGRLEGYGTIDSMRATKNFLGGDPAIVGTGYSGGAIATGWAASLQPTYAPELNIKGWAMGGTPANLTGVVLFLDLNLFSGFLIPAVNGLNRPSTYQAILQPLLSRIITPYGQSLLDSANVNCGTTLLFQASGKSLLAKNIQTLGPALLDDPGLAYVLSQQIMGVYANETPTAPVYMYHAAADEIIPYANASTLASSWCSKGANVHFATFASGGHATTEITGLMPSMQFVAAAFAGNTSVGCSTETVLNPTLDDPLALGLNAEPVLVELINDLIRLGPNDEKLYNNIATTGKIA